MNQIGAKERKGMVTLVNTFHDKTYTSRLSEREILRRKLALNNMDYLYNTRRGVAERAKLLSWARRIHNRLCGSPTCVCGGVLGERT